MKQYINFNHNSSVASIGYIFKVIYKKIEFLLYIFLSIIFLIGSKAQSNFVKNISHIFIEISLPISQAISLPFNIAHDLMFNYKELLIAKDKNKQLEYEINQLKSFYIKSLNIFEENRELKKILNLASTKSSNFKVARIFSRSHQIFNQQIYINIGHNQNIKAGSLVTGNNGIIGRVLNVMNDISSVILLNDSRSKIPVIISNSRIRAILAGNNSNILRLIYLPKDHNIKKGDLIYTSGDGDTLPPGHLAGMVTNVKGEDVEVKMIESVNSTDIVSIVEY